MTEVDGWHRQCTVLTSPAPGWGSPRSSQAESGGGPAVVQSSAALSNFLYTAGFSGHGFLQAPAGGEVVRDLYLEREPVIGISPLSADRFRHGAEIRPEAHVV